jgi:hypothetical protein
MWLGWIAHTVQERKLLLRSLSADDIVVPPIDVIVAAGRFPTYRLPRVREWMGDEAVGFICYAPGPNLDLMRRWFPEAEVTVLTRDEIIAWKRNRGRD